MVVRQVDILPHDAVVNAMRLVMGVVLVAAALVVAVPSASACDVQQTTPAGEVCAADQGGQTGTPLCTTDGSSGWGNTFVTAQVYGVANAYLLASGSCFNGSGAPASHFQHVSAGADAPGVGGAYVTYFGQSGPSGAGFCSVGAGVWTEPTGSVGGHNLPCIYGIPFLGWGNLVP